jgi:hypothetical protein
VLEMRRVGDGGGLLVKEWYELVEEARDYPTERGYL